MPLEPNHSDLLIDLIRTAASVQSRLEHGVLAGDELSFSGYVVLDALSMQGDQEARHLADEVNVARGTLTGIVGRLERRGLVERLPHASDRRSIVVALTDEGRALFELLRPRVLAEQDRLFGHADADRLAAVASTLDDVRHRAGLGG